MERIQEIKLKLMQSGVTPQDQQRVFTNLEVPHTEWSNEEQEFMSRILGQVRAKQPYQGIGCWTVLIVAGVLAYLAFFR